MKGTLLITAALALAANAQTVTPYEGNAFSRMSPDGKWLVEENYGTVTVHDVQRDTTITYGNDAETYAAGLGNCLNNAGTLVGCMLETQPAYWDGETQTWTALPIGENDIFYGSMANGITPDGMTICGSVATGDYIASEDTRNLTPVVWNKQSDGTYGMYEILPCPEYDFLGKVPQYVTALSISNDGNKVVGQLVDNSGFYIFILIYTKDENGNWSYEMPHPDLIYHADALANLPETPGNPPRYPSAEDFMNAEDLAAYQAAMDAYNQAVDDYYNEIIDEYPTFPNAADFLNEEALESYNAAVEQYYEDSEMYWTEYENWSQKMSEVVTGYSFNWNSVSISGNGKYVATELTQRSSAWGPSSVYPARMELAADTIYYQQLQAEDMVTTDVTNDGVVLAAAPASEMTRTSYAFTAVDAAPLNLVDYMKTKNENIAQWLDENMRFDVTLYDYDYETDIEITTTVKDSLITGTVHCNEDATVFTSFYFDMWSTGTMLPMSYTIDLLASEPDGIHSINAAQGPEVSFKNGMFQIEGNMKSIRLYDTMGRQIATAQGNKAQLPAAHGTYIIRMEDQDGNIWSKCVMIK